MPLARPRDPLVLCRPRAPPVVGLVAHLLTIEGDDVRVRRELAVLLDVHRVQVTPDQVVMLERHRALLLDHHTGRTSERADPLAELLRVRDGRRQAHDRDRQREMDQDLLPHPAPVGVLEVVHLVHHDRHEAVERVAALVQHVAQHLGRHDHHRGVPVDRVVPGEQAHLRRSQARDEVPELLVRERLERSRVEALAVSGERSIDGELGHDGLARAGGRGHQHRLAGVERVDGAPLEPVQDEGITSGEAIGMGHGTESTVGSAQPRGPAAGSLRSGRRPASARAAPRRTPRAPRGWTGARRPRSSGGAPAGSDPPSRRRPRGRSCGLRWR